MRFDTNARPPWGSDLEQLMRRYQEGDTTAVTALVECLTPQLYTFFASLTNSSADAEDMLQEAWLRVHRVRHTYRGSEPVLLWLYAIARSVQAKDHRRRRWLAWRKAGVGIFPTSSAREDKAGRMPSFEELVERLPQDQREVLTMLKISGLSAEQVARATSSTAWAVKRRLGRAYGRLRRLLAPAATPQISVP
jgi:RNA polymerase sigma-70 factor (ECF subfamily)